MNWADQQQLQTALQILDPKNPLNAVVSPEDGLTVNADALTGNGAAYNLVNPGSPQNTPVQNSDPDMNGLSAAIQRLNPANPANAVVSPEDGLTVNADAAEPMVTPNTILSGYSGGSVTKPPQIQPSARTVSAEPAGNGTSTTPTPTTTNDSEPGDDESDYDEALNWDDDSSTPNDSNAENSGINSLLQQLLAKKQINIPQSGYELGTGQNMLAALQGMNNSELVNNIGKAGAVIGAGIARQQPNAAVLGLFDKNNEQAQQMPAELQMMVQNEKNDPNSQISGMLRGYLGQQGIQLPDNTSASAIEQLLPTVTKSMLSDRSTALKLLMAQERQAEMEKLLGMRGQQQNQIADKRIAATQNTKNQANQLSVTNRLQQMFSRGAVADAAKAYRLGMNAQSIMNMPDLNQMSQQQYNILLNEMGRISSGGVATKNTFDELGASTFYSKLQNFLSKVENKPTPAQLGQFIQQNKEYLNALQNNAATTIGQHLHDFYNENQNLLTDPVVRAKIESDYKPYFDAYQRSIQNTSGLPQPASIESNISLPQGAPMASPAQAPIQDSQYAPGTVITLKNGKSYQVGPDGHSLIPQ